MYVAVVLGNDAEYTYESNRSYGDWSCFVADSKEEAAAKAMLAAAKWSLELVPDRETHKQRLHRNAPYRVFVGQLNEEAKFPVILEEVI
jgi:hypothetical protein